ncbi:MAG: metal-binding protein [Methyloprofundus sp.]|nr:metal-binding protein [Methyloprofundus sp.]
MSQNIIKCALCGLAVEVEGFNVETGEGLKLFCCAGCLSVYRLLNGDKIKE